MCPYWFYFNPKYYWKLFDNILGFMMDGESDDGEVTKRKYQSRSNCKTAGFLCPGIAIGMTTDSDFDFFWFS